MAIKSEAIIAANRFGLGARPRELNAIGDDARSWLYRQVKGDRPQPQPIATLPSTTTVFKKYVEAQEVRREARKEMAAEAAKNDSEAVQAQRAIQGIRKVLAPLYLEQVAARYRVATTTDEPLRERLIHFWTNHFAVSVDKVVVLGLAAGLENEAIRPNLGKRFVDMLLAVERHPAMILYLDNQQSTGPNSTLAALARRRRSGSERKIGLNENLGREILELHTLGVNGGYTQNDVTTFASALTGWSVGGGRGRLAQGEPGEFKFREALHEPGAKDILGKRYSQDGYEQAKNVLEDLAKHASTAQHIARKLVRHFIGDEPPAAAVARVASVFRESDGHLPSVHQAVIDSAEAWTTEAAKFKTPHEFVVSTFRALGTPPAQPNAIAAPFDLLGQRPYAPGSPAGWADTANQWDGPDALMKRIEWSTAAAQRIGSRVKPLDLAESMLGDSLSDHTRLAIARAASSEQALTLLLMSPEFQRR